MYRIAICDGTEYGKRLTKYLETHMSKEYQIHGFTKLDAFQSWESEADLYLFDETLYEELSDQMKESTNWILLSNSPKKGCFCRYQAPKELLTVIESFFYNDNAEAELLAAETYSGIKSHLVGIFLPVHPANVSKIIDEYSRGRSLIISLEDMSYMEPHHPNASDLCYYIHIREENIMERIQNIVVTQEDGDWIVNPDSYFDLAELDYGDYEWFFKKLSEQNIYETVVLCFGYAAAHKPDFFQFFDEIILVNMEGYQALSHLTGQIQKLLTQQYNIDEKHITIWEESYYED